MRVYSTIFSQFYDVTTDVQFSQILDHRTGLYVGIATGVSEEAAKSLTERGFEIADDETYLAMTTPVVKQLATTEAQTGDPLKDAKPAPKGSKAAAPAKDKPAAPAKDKAAKATAAEAPVAEVPAEADTEEDQSDVDESMPPAPPSSAE